MGSRLNILRSEKLYVVLLAGLLISIPFRYAYSSVALIVLLGISITSLLKHKIEFRKEQIVPAMMYLLMVASLLWTVDKDNSLRGLERQLPYIALPVAFILMPRLSRGVFERVLYVFSLFMAGLALFFIALGLYKYAASGDRAVLFYHELVAPMRLNAIYMSVLAAMSLLFLSFYIGKKILIWVAVAILLVFLVLLSSKNILLITFISVLIGLTIKRNVNRKRLVIFGLVAVAVLAVFFYGPVKQRVEEELASNIKEVLTCEEFNRVYPWTGTTIRLFQARAMYELANRDEIWLTGYGINAAQEKLVEKQKDYNLYWGYFNYNFHNQYVQTTAELGIPGLLILLLMLVLLALHYRRQRELFVLLFLIVMLSIFFTETFAWRQRGMIFFLVLYGLIFKCDLITGKNTKTT